MTEGEQWPAGYDRLARCSATRDQLVRGVPLSNHSANEDDIRPGQIYVAQFSDVDIHEAFRPILRQHRRHGEQPQRRQRSFLADEFQRVLETPERIRKFRVRALMGFPFFLDCTEKNGFNQTIGGKPGKCLALPRWLRALSETVTAPWEQIFVD